MPVLTSAVINVLSVANHKSLEKVDKHIDAVLLLIELDTLFSTHSTANLSDTTQTTLSNTSHLT
jgi:hypothetical protein